MRGWRSRDFVARSKTDQDGLGFVFHVSEENYKGFSMLEASSGMWTVLDCLTAIICSQDSGTQVEAKLLLRASTWWDTAQWLLSLRIFV